MEAFWLTELKKGSVEPLDAFLATTGHHRMQLSELPPEEELKPCKPLDLRTGSSLRREEKKRKRNANKREKQASLREAGTHKIAETEKDQGLRRGALTENGCSETGGQRSAKKAVKRRACRSSTTLWSLGCCSLEKINSCGIPASLLWRRL